jgi:hypothetical protein
MNRDIEEKGNEIVRSMLNRSRKGVKEKLGFKII